MPTAWALAIAAFASDVPSDVAWPDWIVEQPPHELVGRLTTDPRRDEPPAGGGLGADPRRREVRLAAGHVGATEIDADEVVGGGFPSRHRGRARGGARVEPESGANRGDVRAAPGRGGRGRMRRGVRRRMQAAQSERLRYRRRRAAPGGGHPQSVDADAGPRGRRPPEARCPRRRARPAPGSRRGSRRSDRSDGRDSVARHSGSRGRRRGG